MNKSPTSMDSRLASMESKQDMMYDLLTQHTKDAKRQHEEIGHRLRSLEKWKNYTTGIVAAAGISLGTLWDKLGG